MLPLTYTSASWPAVDATGVSEPDAADESVIGFPLPVPVLVPSPVVRDEITSCPLLSTVA